MLLTIKRGSVVDNNETFHENPRLLGCDVAGCRYFRGIIQATRRRGKARSQRRGGNGDVYEGERGVFMEVMPVVSRYDPGEGTVSTRLMWRGFGFSCVVDLATVTLVAVEPPDFRAPSYELNGKVWSFRGESTFVCDMCRKTMRDLFETAESTSMDEVKKATILSQWSGMVTRLVSAIVLGSWHLEGGSDVAERESSQVRSLFLDLEREFERKRGPITRKSVEELATEAGKAVTVLLTCGLMMEQSVHPFKHAFDLFYLEGERRLTQEWQSTLSALTDGVKQSRSCLKELCIVYRGEKITFEDYIERECDYSFQAAESCLEMLGRLDSPDPVVADGIKRRFDAFMVRWLELSRFHLDYSVSKG